MSAYRPTSDRKQTIAADVRIHRARPRADTHDLMALTIMIQAHASCTIVPSHTVALVSQSLSPLDGHSPAMFPLSLQMVH